MRDAKKRNTIKKYYGLLPIPLMIGMAVFALGIGAMGCKSPTLADPNERMLPSSLSARRSAGLTLSASDSLLGSNPTPTPDGRETAATLPTPDGETTAETPDNPGNPEASPSPRTGFRPIPAPLHPRELVVDEDHIYAIVNGEVISVKDVRRTIGQDRLASYELARRITSRPWQSQESDVVTFHQQQELRANFYRKAVDLVYRQRAHELRFRLGSIPRENIEKAIRDTRMRHGIVGTGPEADRRWVDVLRRSNMTYFDFEQQIRDQMEATRVAQFLAFAPDERLGINFDITPLEMLHEYAANPVEATRNVVLYRVRFPLVLESQAEKDRELKRANDFLSEVQRRFDDVDRRHRHNPPEWLEGRRKAFFDLAKAYFPTFSAEPEKLADLGDEKPEVATEIRRTPVGDLSTSVSLTDEIVILFLIAKEQSGLEPFSSAAVQNELERRLLNRRWNDFRVMVDRQLLRESTIISTEAGIIDLDK